MKLTKAPKATQGKKIARKGAKQTPSVTVTFTGKNAREILSLAHTMETTPEKAAAYWLDLSFKIADEEYAAARKAYQQRKAMEKLAERIEPVVVAKLFGPPVVVPDDSAPLTVTLEGEAAEAIKTVSRKLGKAPSHFAQIHCEASLAAHGVIAKPTT